MTKRKTASKRKAKAKPRKPSAAPRPYVMPHTAAELGIKCAECGNLAEYFDYERARRDHLKGFVCGNESRSAKSEKLLVAEQGIKSVES